MSSVRTENLFQAVRRHLGNGYTILTERGPRALFGAAMLEAAKIVDAPTGPFLAPRDLIAEGRAFAGYYGVRATAGAVLRQLAAEHDPPSGRGPETAGERSRARTGDDGFVYARRPPDNRDCALETPFRYAAGPPRTDRVAAIVHVFYLDTLPDILDRLGNVPAAVDLFISTDTQPKRDEIGRQTANWTKGLVDIRVARNRGRDIAPKLLTFRDVYDRYDVFLHLHSKKSPHAGASLSGWRDHLLDNLIGDPQTAASNLSLFDDPKIGFVFAQHMFAMRGGLNWGHNFAIARTLMRRLGVDLDPDLVLEFPAGSMFWGRSAALRPILDLELDLSDFPEESGQVDGTLAHAIERIVLMAGETRGFEWLKVIRRRSYPLSSTVLSVGAPGDIARHRARVFQPCLAPMTHADGARVARDACPPRNR